MKTHALTIKLIAKKPKNVRNCESRVSDGETTLIYASPSGGKLRMMIVNLESEEASVVELKLSDHAIKRWLQDPKDNAEEKK